MKKIIFYHPSVCSRITTLQKHKILHKVHICWAFRLACEECSQKFRLTSNPRPPPSRTIISVFFVDSEESTAPFNVFILFGRTSPRIREYIASVILMAHFFLFFLTQSCFFFLVQCEYWVANIISLTSTGNIYFDTVSKFRLRTI